MTNNIFSLEGKLILVTGAGTGIGRGVALELARQGADVAISYRSSAQGAMDVVAEIISMGRRSTAIQADMGVAADCYRVVDEAVKFLGGLDGLFNNAGVTITMNFQDVTEEVFNKIYNVNIRGQFFTCQRAVSYMIERGQELRQRSRKALGRRQHCQHVLGSRGCRLRRTFCLRGNQGGDQRI